MCSSLKAPTDSSNTSALFSVAHPRSSFNEWSILGSLHGAGPIGEQPTAAEGRPPNARAVRALLTVFFCEYLRIIPLSGNIPPNSCKDVSPS
jgi:hypothetical protein